MKLIYSAIWEQNLVKLMYFVIQGSVYTILEDLRNRDNTGLVCSELLQIVLNIEHCCQLHRTSSNMHFWNMRRGPQIMSVKNSDHVTKKVGLKSTSGKIGSDRDIVDQ